MISHFQDSKLYIYAEKYTLDVVYHDMFVYLRQLSIVFDHQKTILNPLYRGHSRRLQCKQVGIWWSITNLRVDLQKFAHTFSLNFRNWPPLPKFFTGN